MRPLAPCCVRSATTCGPVGRPSAIQSAAAMTTLTAGPATAIHSSCFGLGRFSMLATPPMGYSVMLDTGMP